MNRVILTVVTAVVAVSGLGGLAGCSQNQQREQEKMTADDPRIQHYLERRNDLLAQKRRLESNYGENSPQVAAIDRQIELVDAAVEARRDQLTREEQARKQVEQMKRQAAPADRAEAQAEVDSQPQQGNAPDAQPAGGNPAPAGLPTPPQQ